VTTKIAISLPDDLVRSIRRAVDDGESPSVSAYIADALRYRKREGSLRELLDELDREHGPPSAADDAWARDQLGITT